MTLLIGVEKLSGTWNWASIYRPRLFIRVHGDTLPTLSSRYIVVLPLLLSSGAVEAEGCGYYVSSRDRDSLHIPAFSTSLVKVAASPQLCTSELGHHAKRSHQNCQGHDLVARFEQGRDTSGANHQTINMSQPYHSSSPGRTARHNRRPFASFSSPEPAQVQIYPRQ